jgi:hypothetical protein
VEREKGLEPSTFAMATRRSSQLSYSRPRSHLDKGLIPLCQVVSHRWLLHGVVSCLGGEMKTPNQNFFRRLWTGIWSAPDRDRNQHKKLVAARPARLASPPVWEPVSDESLLDEQFLRLRQQVIGGAEDPGSLVVPRQILVRKAGRLPGERRFFFMQQPGQDGWLFERAPAGWIVSRATEDVGRGLFVRSGEAWDVVMLMQAPGMQGVRVASRRFGTDQLPLSVYEQKLGLALERAAAS